MDVGLRSPLMEAFRRYDVPLEVRLEAAAGRFSPKALEQLGLLLLLVDDKDAAVRDAAEQTLRGLDGEHVGAVLALPETPVEMVKFFADRGIAPRAAAVDEAAPVVDDDEEWALEGGAEDGQSDADREKSITHQLAQMTIVQRVRAAMKGSREIRSLLVRDPNKMVASAVLSSPKLTLAEVESFAKMANVSEDVLRAIGQNRAWVKSYAVAHSLTRNPKTPIALSMNLLARIADRDVKAISVDRNVPEPLRVAARKRVSANQLK